MDLISKLMTMIEKKKKKKSFRRSTKKISHLVFDIFQEIFIVFSFAASFVIMS